VPPATALRSSICLNGDWGIAAGDEHEYSSQFDSGRLARPGQPDGGLAFIREFSALNPQPAFPRLPLGAVDPFRSPHSARIFSPFNFSAGRISAQFLPHFCAIFANLDFEFRSLWVIRGNLK
jgi:hypothetical protein